MALSDSRTHPLAQAAMLGLLAAVGTACSDDGGTSEVEGAAGAPAQQATDGTGAESDEGGNGEDPASADAGSSGEESETSEGGAGGSSAKMITSSTSVSGVTKESFTQECDKVDGIVETHASCPAANTGPGFSWDDTRDLWTEHTCALMNTCSGFSCKIPE